MATPELFANEQFFGNREGITVVEHTALTSSEQTARDSRVSSAPDLAGVAVVLRPIEPGDLEFLYSIAVSVENGFRWRYRGAVPDRSEFVNGLSNGVLVQFVVERKATAEPMGMVTAYGANPRDGWVYVAALTAPKHISSGATMDGLVVLIDYVFKNWPMRKIYFEALEFNFSQFQGASAQVAHEEGRLRQHVFYGGSYWDLVTGAIYREEWAEWSVRPQQSSVSPEARSEMDFEEFCNQMRSVLELKTEHIREDMALFEDLGFDSMKMVELAAFIEDIAGKTQFEMLGEVDTVRDAYLWYCTASSMPVTNPLS